MEKNNLFPFIANNTTVYTLFVSESTKYVPRYFFSNKPYK